MPKSKSRRNPQAVYTPPNPGVPQAVKIGNPSWLAPTMVGMFLLGLLWIVVFYLAGPQVPLMQDFSNLVNVLIGFGFIGVGFALSTKWR
ncbi:MAG: hypothetical protein F2839_01455 [Actinobacteria bacterium]|uniref:Unannotated protein n=1 Tax=freshwater metagenome TaxID=449393 RepID=A0A6J5YPJ7_9ZZZZ|nr:hypothetical protein [Actinomycetota bacterium]